MSDASLNTGFGKVLHNIAYGLSESGLETFFIGWGFKYESSIPRTNYTLLPCGNDPFGQDVLPYYIQQIKPEVLIVQSDTRMTAYIPQMLKQLPVKPTFVHYVVVDGSTWQIDGKDHWPINWSQIIKGADKVVAMSKYGQQVLKSVGIDSEVIYHGVDTTQFLPVSPEQRKSLKKQVGLGEDKFVFLGVFKSMQRKNPEKYLQAFKIFLESKELTQAEKDNCVLVLHTQPQPQQGGEYDLVEQCVDCGLQPGKNVIFSAQGVPVDRMQLIYQTADVFMHLGTMEGFGIPILEAMSCGLPIIGVDSCTMPELIGDCGILSEVPRYKNNQKIKYGSFNGVEAELVDPWDVAKQMLKLYKSEALRKELGTKATEKAVREFDWTLIRKQWVEYVGKLVLKAEDVPAEWARLMEETKV
jgi:glycosyltransferase involved in cell wall biosynthesis